MLHYEKLDVYQVSIQFVATAVAMSEQIPKGYAALADPLRRAAWSIPLNIAEGVGKPSVSDQARFHAIARGSAMECGAILDVVRAAEERPPGADQCKAARCAHGRNVDQDVPVDDWTRTAATTTTLTLTLTMYDCSRELLTPMGIVLPSSRDRTGFSFIEFCEFINKQ